jgi:hypothetical protein
MPKLHELIAVEPDLKASAIRSFKEVSHTFGSPTALVGEVRTYQPLEEGGDEFPDEITNLSTTVSDLLSQLSGQYGNWLDVAMQKEVSNSVTSADVVVDGEVLFAELPTPALLNLESKLGELRAIYAALPTLDPTERWNFDTGQGCYVSEPRVTFRTQKVLRNHVKAEATPEHPAQVEVYTEDERVGRWTKIVRSGMVTVVQKRQMLSRIDRLAQAVKKARQRANDVEANVDEYAATLFDYINEGIL